MQRRPMLRALSLAVLIALAACESSTEPVGEGRYDGFWGSNRFTGTAVAAIDGSVLEVYGHGTPGGDETVGVRVRITDFAGPGTYSIDADEAEVVHVVGGDVLGSRYETTSAGAGTLRVESVAHGRVIGSVRFDAETTTPERMPVGERARFQGTFDAYLPVP
jgi:hypothetical protein